MSKLDQLNAEVGSNVDREQRLARAGRPGGSSPTPRPRHRPGLVGVRRSNDAAQIDLDRIVPDPDQPRKEFTEAQMAEMTESLRERRPAPAGPGPLGRGPRQVPAHHGRAAVPGRRPGRPQVARGRDRRGTAVTPPRRSRSRSSRTPPARTSGRSTWPTRSAG